MRIPVTGVLPVVLPNGRLVLAFWSGRTGMVSVTSGDGGVTLDPPVTISPLRARETRPFRAPPLIAAEVDQTGGVVAVWQDCRFDTDCSANDVVLSRSPDGTHGPSRSASRRAATSRSPQSASSRAPAGWRSSTT